MFFIPNTIALLFSSIYIVRDREKELADWHQEFFREEYSLVILPRSFSKAAVRLQAVSLFLENLWEEHKTSENVSVTCKVVTLQAGSRAGIRRWAIQWLLHTTFLMFFFWIDTLVSNFFPCFAMHTLLGPHSFRWQTCTLKSAHFCCIPQILLPRETTPNLSYCQSYVIFDMLTLILGLMSYLVLTFS